MNAKAKQGAVQVVNTDGTTSPATLDSFLNGQSAALEAMRPAPVLHKRELVVVQTTPDDYAQIKGGQLYLKHSARSRVATAAGVREIGPPQIRTVQDGDRNVTQVFVGLTRPPMVNDPVWGWADGCLSDAKPAEREHYLAKLATRAHSRALKKLLGESFLYSKQDVEARGGRFLVACVTPDTSDSDVREIMLAKMRGGSEALYGHTPQPAALPPAPAATDELGDVFTDAEFDEEDYEDHGAGDGESVAPPPGAAVTGSSDATPAPVPELPLWTLGIPVNGDGPRWGTIPADKLRDRVRGELKAIKYDVAGDPAGLIGHGKAGAWADAAQALFDWQMGGGADA